MQTLELWQQRLLHKRAKIDVSPPKRYHQQEQEEEEEGGGDVVMTAAVEEEKKETSTSASAAVARLGVLSAGGLLATVYDNHTIKLSSHVHCEGIQQYLLEAVHDSVHRYQQRLEHAAKLWQHAISTRDKDLAHFMLRKLCAWKLVETIDKAKRIAAVKEKSLVRVGAAEKKLFSNWISFCLSKKAELELTFMQNAPPSLQVLKYYHANDFEKATEIAIKHGYARLATIVSQGIESFANPSRKVYAEKLIKLWLSNGTLDLMDRNLSALYCSLSGLPDELRKSSWMFELAHQIWTSKSDTPVRSIWHSVKALTKTGNEFPELKHLLDLHFILPALPDVLKHEILQNCILSSEDVRFTDVSFSWELMQFITTLNLSVEGLEVNLPRVFAHFLEQLERFGLWERCIYLIQSNLDMLSQYHAGSFSLQIMCRHFTNLKRKEVDCFENLDQNIVMKDIYDIIGSAERPTPKELKNPVVLRNTLSFKENSSNISETMKLLQNYGANMEHVHMAKIIRIKALNMDSLHYVKECLKSKTLVREAQSIFATVCLPKYILKDLNLGRRAYKEFEKELNERPIEDPFLKFFAKFFESFDEFEAIVEKMPAYQASQLLEATWFIQAMIPENIKTSPIDLSGREKSYLFASIAELEDYLAKVQFKLSMITTSLTH